MAPLELCERPATDEQACRERIVRRGNSHCASIRSRVVVKSSALSNHGAPAASTVGAASKQAMDS